MLVGSGGTRIVFNEPRFYSGALPAPVELASPRREKVPVVGSSGSNLITGFITYNGDGTRNAELVIDRNNDGDIDAGDKTGVPSNNQWEFRSYTTEAYGARYIRWANMAWCR